MAKLTKHLVYGSSSIERLAVTAARATFGAPGYETDRHYLAALLALVLGGSGACSIDGHRQRRRRRLTG